MADYLLNALTALNVNETLGALVIGAVVTNILYGVTSVQTYIYFNEGRNQNDGIMFRAIVTHVLLFVELPLILYLRQIIFLWVLDTVETTLLAHLVYHYSVSWAFNPGILSTIVWSAPLHLLVGIIGDIIITGLFSWRIWKFGGQIWPIVLIMIPAVLSFVAFLVACIRALVDDNLLNFQKTSTWVWEAAYSLKIASDVAVMLCLCYILFKNRPLTPIARTNAIINKLILCSINTCILTSTVAVAALVTFVAIPNSFWWITLTAISPKMMMNSLMALLNSRESMKTKLLREQPLSIHLSRLDTDLVMPRSPMAPVQMSAGRALSPEGAKNIVIRVESDIVDDRSYISAA
ncbi:hypothetical protein BDW22DRAFT_1422473 [Trametopsis cervina]|nr:hypothetical protein BDW22DRAFT_1422473 [Trametopsis cervina]